MQNGAPDGTWTTLSPSMSSKVPVNAKAVRLHCWNSDSGDIVAVNVSNADATRTLIAGKSYEHAKTTGWVDLGSTKNLQWYGDDDDDNFWITLYGWDLER